MIVTGLIAVCAITAVDPRTEQITYAKMSDCKKTLTLKLGYDDKAGVNASLRTCYERDLPKAAHLANNYHFKTADPKVQAWLKAARAGVKKPFPLGVFIFLPKECKIAQAPVTHTDERA